MSQLEIGHKLGITAPKNCKNLKICLKNFKNLIYIMLKDYVMNYYNREILILFKIMISLLCHAYNSIQFFASIYLLFAKFFLAMVQVEPNRYLSDLSSSSEGSSVRLDESETSNRSTRVI